MNTRKVKKVETTTVNELLKKYYPKTQVQEANVLDPRTEGATLALSSLSKYEHMLHKKLKQSPVVA